MKLKKICFVVTPLLFFVALQGCNNNVVKNEGARVPSPAAIMCTKEAKRCPDGSFVGRTGPNCEFATCPTK